MRRMLLLFGAAFAAGLILSVAAFAGQRLVAGPGGQTLTEHRDEETGFAISYPRDWQRVSVPDPEVRLVVTPNGQDSVLVRAVTLEAEVTAQDLPAMAAFTDQLVRSSDQAVQVLRGPERVDIGGLPGILYVYTFEDAASNRQGVHSHYFLFEGTTMFVIVLQALPTEGFQALAPTFQEVIDSFELLSS